MNKLIGAKETNELVENLLATRETIDTMITFIQANCEHETIDAGDTDHSDIVCIICKKGTKTVVTTEEPF